MKYLFLIFSISTISFASSPEQLGLTVSDFNFLSGLSGLLSGTIISYSIIKSF